MPTLVQKRALAALSKNLKEAERAHAQALDSYLVAKSLLGPNHPNTKATARREYAARAAIALPRFLLKNFEKMIQSMAARKIQSAYRRYRSPKRVSPKRSPYTPRSMRRIPRTNLN